MSSPIDREFVHVMEGAQVSNRTGRNEVREMLIQLQRFVQSEVNSILSRQGKIAPHAIRARVDMYRSNYTPGYKIELNIQWIGGNEPISFLKSQRLITRESFPRINLFSSEGYHFVRNILTEMWAECVAMTFAHGLSSLIERYTSFKVQKQKIDIEPEPKNGEAKQPEPTNVPDRRDDDGLERKPGDYDPLDIPYGEFSSPASNSV